MRASFGRNNEKKADLTIVTKRQILCHPRSKTGPTRNLGFGFVAQHRFHFIVGRPRTHVISSLDFGSRVYLRAQWELARSLAERRTVSSRCRGGAAAGGGGESEVSRQSGCGGEGHAGSAAGSLASLEELRLRPPWLLALHAKVS